MPRIYQIFLICLVAFSDLPLDAQISFQRESTYINTFNSNISVISADMNGDQQDDLVFLHDNKQLVVSLNNGLQRSWRRIEGPAIGGFTWSGLVADFNNDGKMEIVIGTSSSPVRIYTFDPVVESFVVYWQCPFTFFVQNMNASDVNNDGFIDLFMCDDLSTNHLFINDESGGFVADDKIDFNTVPVSDNSGNYGSVFIDYDLDGDRDFYIAKCRAGVTDPNDPRRINQLYEQQADGTYIDVSKDLGLDIGAQSWVADFADLDIDGDLDLVVCNHGDPIQLFRNDNGTYVEIDDIGDLQFDVYTWQLSMHDFDNDRYPDILITADDTYYFHNDGDWTFTLQTNAFGGGPQCYSHGVGDFNNDGFLDILTAYGTTPSSSLQDSIWLNQGNNNNWIAFSLEGVSTNRDAEGTRVDIFSQGKQLIRHVKLGHSYGIQDTKMLHFGLAEGEADSVKIYWTNSPVQKLVAPEINRKYYIKEGICTEETKTPIFSLSLPCEGEGFQMLFDDPSFKKWNDDSQESEYSTTSLGPIYAEYGNDCVLKSWITYPEFLDTTSTYLQDIPLLEGVFLPCPDEEIVLTSVDPEAVWNNTIVSSSYVSVEPGLITLEEQIDCQTIYSTFLREDAYSDFVVPTSVIKYDAGQNLTVDVGSSTARWYDNESDIEFFFEGASYTFQQVEQDREVWIEDYIENNYEAHCGIQEINTPSYTGNSFNPIVYFEVETAITLQSIKVYSNVEGVREIMILNENEELYFSKSFNIIDETILDLDVELAPGEYSITTDINQNFANLGTAGPILARVPLPSSTSFPFTDENEILSITGSSLNQNFYYSFFDWQLDGGVKICDKRYRVLLEDVVASALQQTRQFTYTNPINSVMLISYDSEAEFYIYDSRGVEVFHSRHDGGESMHDLSWMTSGLYFIELEGQVEKLVKQ